MWKVLFRTLVDFKTSGEGNERPKVRTTLWRSGDIPPENF